MTVRFILGRSGTGKTRHCTDSIIEALLDGGQHPLILLVPEQASYQAEKAILSDGRISGYSRLHVLSFNRLGFLLLGRRMALGALSRSGQEMAVQAILATHQARLTTICASRPMPGLAAEVCRSLTEFQRSGLEPDDVANLAAMLAKQPATEMASRKFIDLATIYRLYREFLTSRFLDPDTELSEARKAVSLAPFLQGARLWIDGFAGFTRQEFELLLDVLKVVDQADIALCLDPAQLNLENCTRQDLDPTSLFYPTECTYADLLEAIRKKRLEVASPIRLDKTRRFASPAIAHIEKSLAGRGGARCNAAGQVRLLAASNERAEAEFAAAEVRRLIRTMGYRYRDIAVVAPDVNSCRHYMEAAFHDCGVPVFIDTPRPLSRHVVAELTTAAMRAVAEGFHTNHVLAFLKSGLGPLAQDDVGMLENYCLANGVDGADWTASRPWSLSARETDRLEEARAESLRRTAVSPLQHFLAATTKPDGKLSAEEFTAAVFDLFEELDVRSKLAGLPADAEEHRRFYDRFVSLFDEMAEVFAGMRMAPAEFQSVLQSAMENTTLATIPPTLDQVLVGTIERSRHPDIKATILVGCCQGQFPSPIRQTSVLTDEDRLAAEAAGMPLGETVDSQLAARQYLTYIALTRASERLYLLWPLSGQEGSAASPSDCVDKLTELFSGLSVESVRTASALPQDAAAESHLADILTAGLGLDTTLAAGDAAALQRFVAALRNTGELTDVTHIVELSLGYKNKAKLNAAAAAEAFGREIHSSVTRLSSFAACPYQHFAGYMLGLSPRQQFRFEPLDLGTFFHDVLDALTKRLLENGQTFASVTPQQLAQMLDQSVEQELSAHSFLSAFRARSPFNAFIIQQAVDTLHQCATSISQAASAGSLRTIASELTFGLGRGGLPGLKVQAPAGKTMLLRGKIDRLDIATDAGQTLAFVFDYKTTAKRPDYTNIYYGLDLQLPVYLLALQGHKLAGTGDLVPAGAFFFPIKVPLEKMSIDDVAQGATPGFPRKAAGIFDGEHYSLLDGSPGQSSRFYNFSITQKDAQYGRYSTSGALRPADYEQLLSFVRTKLETLASQIVGGRIDTQPYRIGNVSPCSNCDFRPVCRFDWQVNEYNFLPSIGKTDLLGLTGGAG